MSRKIAYATKKNKDSYLLETSFVYKIPITLQHTLNLKHNFDVM